LLLPIIELQIAISQMLYLMVDFVKQIQMVL